MPTTSDKPKTRFNLQDLLLIATLAALGGVSSSFVSHAGRALHIILPPPVGGQPLAGIHVLWLLIATGIIGKPGAATATGILKGAVEMLSGNPHGIIVLAYAGLQGASVDLILTSLRYRHSQLRYALAGGTATASNILVLTVAGSLPTHGSMLFILATMATVAFISGTILAGALAWTLLHALHRAGITVAATTPTPPSTRSPWASATLAAAVVLFFCTASYLALAKTSATPSATQPPTSTTVTPNQP